MGKLWKQGHPAAIIAGMYGLSLSGFTLFRLLLCIAEIPRLGPEWSGSDVAKAFLMGLRFDTVISGYLLLLPFLVLTVIHLSRVQALNLRKGVFMVCFILYALAFLVAAADIPYFGHFFTRLNVDAFQWADSPAFVLGMLAGEPTHWIFLLPYIALLWLFHRAMRIVWRPVLEGALREGPVMPAAAISVVALGLMVLGIRGRLDEKSPIRVGTAYFGTDPFLNQLGLNPNFTLIRSFLDSRKESNQPVQLMPDEEAVRLVQQQLGIQVPDPRYPLSRSVPGSGDRARKHNVVLILMESMSARNLDRHGRAAGLTPFLDSLSRESVYFSQCYAAGIHTHNGIFSSLFSYPAIFGQHALKESAILRYDGFARTLKEHGYATLYFTTHDGQFDNVEGFLRANDFDRVITKADYPPREVKTTLGVPDDYLFRFAVPMLDQVADTDKPFFAAMLTGSNHIPYYLPEYYTPRSNDPSEQMIEYSDWALRRFFELASQQPWFGQTLFIITGDHGTAMDGTYAMPLSYNHVPLLFYTPGGAVRDTVIETPSGQIDLFPTAMGILGLPWVNNTMGVDLLRERRPHVLFNGDDKFGVIDGEWLLIARKDGAKTLHRHALGDRTDHSSGFPDVVQRMYRYGAAQIQATQYVVRNRKQGHD